MNNLTPIRKCFRCEVGQIRCWGIGYPHFRSIVIRVTPGVLLRIQPVCLPADFYKTLIFEFSIHFYI